MSPARLERAVHQLTQILAELMGLKQRGLLREGWHAGTVLRSGRDIRTVPLTTG